MPPSLPYELWDPVLCPPNRCHYSGRPVPSTSSTSTQLRATFLDLYNTTLVTSVSFSVGNLTDLIPHVILRILSTGVPPSGVASVVRSEGLNNIRQFLREALEGPTPNTDRGRTLGVALAGNAFGDACYILANALPRETQSRPSWNTSNFFCLHDLVDPNAAGLKELERVKKSVLSTLFKDFEAARAKRDEERTGPQTALVDEVRARVSRRDLVGAEYMRSSVWRKKLRETVEVAYEVFDEVVRELAHEKSVGQAYRSLLEFIDPVRLWTLASRDSDAYGSRSVPVRFGSTGFLGNIVEFCEWPGAVQELERLSWEQREKEEKERKQAERLANAPKTNGTPSASTSTLSTPAEEAAAAAKMKDDAFDAVMVRSKALKRLAEIREEKSLAESELEGLRKRIGEMEKESAELEKVLAPPAPAVSAPPKNETSRSAAAAGGSDDDEMPGLVGESDDEGPPPAPAPKKSPAPSRKPAPPKAKAAVSSDDDMPALVAISDDEGPKPKPAPTAPKATAPPRTTAAPAPKPKPKPAAPESDDEMPALVGISDDEATPAPKATPKTAAASKAPTPSASTSKLPPQPSESKPAPPQLSTNKPATPPTPQPKRTPIAVSDDDMPALVPISDDDEKPKPLSKSAKKKAATPAKPPAAATVDSDDDVPGLVGESDEDEWDSDEDEWDSDDGSDGSTEQGDSDPDDVDLAAVDRPALTCNCPPGTHGPAPRTRQPNNSKPKPKPATRPTITSPKVIPTVPTPAQRTLPASKPSTLYGSLPRIVPPTCCPPDRCTKVQPHHSSSTQPGHLEFSALDAILVDVFRTQVINAMAAENGARLEELRSIVVAGILAKVDKLDVADPATRKLVEDNVDKALGEDVCDPPAQSMYGRRALLTGLMTGLGIVSAISATPSSSCICQLSAGLDALKSLASSLTAKTTAAQMELRNLGPVEPVDWETWATAGIKMGTLKSACWKDSKWQASMRKVVLLIERTFNEAAESVDDAFFVADYLETISWLGGVRVYEETSRLPRDDIESFPLEGSRSSNMPLAHWEDLVLLAGTARKMKEPLTFVSAENIKLEGDEEFEKRHHSRSTASYATASLMNPLSVPARTNAALARLKIGSNNELQRAIADCTLAIYYDEKNYKAFYRRGQALVRLKKFDLAISDLEQALKLDPNNWAIREELQLARSRGVSKGKK